MSSANVVDLQIGKLLRFLISVLFFIQVLKQSQLTSPEVKVLIKSSSRHLLIFCTIPGSENTNENLKSRFKSSSDNDAILI